MALKSVQEPVTGRTVFSLSNPIGSVMTMVGVALGFGFLFYLLGVGRNEIAPLLNHLGGRLTGGRVDAGTGSSGFGEVF